MLYLDNAATSFPKAPGVMDAMVHYMQNIGASSGRSSYSAARDASRILFRTRQAIAQLIGVTNSEGIIFCNNATHALNIAIQGLVQPGMHVVTSCLEHNSVMRPLRALQVQGITISQFGILPSGLPDLEAFSDLLKTNPDVVICTAASNVSGVIFPIHRIAALAKAAGAKVIVDASQIIGAYPFSVETSTMDCVCFPGHKGLLGPSGTGVLWVHPQLELPALMQGGTGSRSDSEWQPIELPDRLESGTPNIVGIAGLEAAVNYLLQQDVVSIRDHKLQLISRLTDGLQSLHAITLHSPMVLEHQVGVISITARRMDCAALTWQLDKRDIAVRMGLHCAPGAHQSLGTYEGGGTVRLSPGCFTTENEIDTTITILTEILA